MLRGAPEAHAACYKIAISLIDLWRGFECYGLVATVKSTALPVSA
jgi:hypothetical protein